MWGEMHVSPIVMGEGSGTNCNLQSRGISLLSCVYKLYSSVLNSCLFSFLEVLELTDDSQNGFRGGRSCEDHITSLILQIQQVIIAGKDSFCCYIDMQKPFR